MDRDDAIISRFDTATPFVHRVVDEDQLGSMAYQGWALVAVLYTDELVAWHDTESVPYRDPNNSHTLYTDTKTKTARHVVRQARFLVRLDESSALAQKEAELEEAKHAAAEAKNEIRQNEEKYAALTKEKEKLQTESASYRKHYERAIADKDTVQKTTRKLEIDIGKIREAIGAKQMKEILGTP